MEFVNTTRGRKKNTLLNEMYSKYKIVLQSVCGWDYMLFLCLLFLCLLFLCLLFLCLLFLLFLMITCKTSIFSPSYLFLLNPGKVNKYKYKLNMMKYILALLHLMYFCNIQPGFPPPPPPPPPPQNTSYI